MHINNERERETYTAFNSTNSILPKSCAIMIENQWAVASKMDGQLNGAPKNFGLFFNAAQFSNAI